VANAYVDGAVAVLADTAVYTFIGPTVSVTIAAGNRIHVSGSATLGSTAVGGATLSRFSVCHQTGGAGALSDNDADWSLVRVPQNTRVPMATTQRISGLAAGTYTVGFCYQAGAGQAVNWNYNDWVNLDVIVTQN
jgi:hypothetical protein